MVHIRLIAVGDRCQWLSVTRAQYLEDTAITGGMGLPGNQMLLRRDRVGRKARDALGVDQWRIPR